MLQRVRRQRRRLALCALAAAAGAALASDGDAGQVFLAAAVAALSTTVCVAVLVAVAPSWRWVALKLSVVVALVGLAHRLGVPPGGVAAMAAGLALLLPSQPSWLDALRLPFITTARVERRLVVPADVLWKALLPVPGKPHWDPNVAAVRECTDPRDLVIAYSSLGGDTAPSLQVRLFDVEPPRHFKARDLSLPSAGDGGPVTVASHVVEPDGDDASRLVLMEASWRQGLWTGFTLWLDDYLADNADRLTAVLEGRKDRSLRGATLAATMRRARLRPR